MHNKTHLFLKYCESHYLLTLDFYKPEFLTGLKQQNTNNIHNSSLNTIYTNLFEILDFDKDFALLDQTSARSKTCYYSVRELHYISVLI